VADALKDQADHEITVEGHTDAQGSDASNIELSQGRAQSVREYLVGHGVPANRIKSEGLGESRPVADNNTPEGRANNRRVEIIVAPAKEGTSTTGSQGSGSSTPGTMGTTKPSTLDNSTPAQPKPPAGGAAPNR
jgi:hypothetical protein